MSFNYKPTGPIMGPELTLQEISDRESMSPKPKRVDVVKDEDLQKQMQLALGRILFRQKFPDVDPDIPEEVAQIEIQPKLDQMGPADAQAMKAYVDKLLKERSME